MNTDDLKKMKAKRNFTTKQISDLSGIPESTISRILSGQTDNPTFDTICAIVKAMGGSLDKLTDIDTDSDTPDLSALISLYEKVIKEKNKYIKILIIISCSLAAVLAFAVLFDVVNGSVGFVKY